MIRFENTEVTEHGIIVDIIAPIYWWEDFNCIFDSGDPIIDNRKKDLTLDDFSHEHLTMESLAILKSLIDHLNKMRNVYRESKEIDKKFWWQQIQLMPTSLNMKYHIGLSFEDLRLIHKFKKNDEFDEWGDFCNWIERLPKGLNILDEGENTDELYRS